MLETEGGGGLLSSVRFWGDFAWPLRTPPPSQVGLPRGRFAAQPGPGGPDGS